MGFESRRVARQLNDYMELLGRFGCRPTFAVTGALADRNAGQLQELQARGAEIAVHYGALIDRHPPPTQQRRDHIQRSVAAFHRQGIAFGGFRGPSSHGDSLDSQTLVELGFRYTSNCSLAWEVMDREQFTPDSLRAYQRLLEDRHSGDSTADLSLPTSIHGLTDLPVAMPDDEALVDLMQLAQGSAASVWLRILQRVHRLGELLVLSLRPERLDAFHETLEAVLGRAGEYSPAIWLATLDEVSSWWQERQAASLSVRSLGEGQYEVEANGAQRATLLLRNLRTRAPTEPWYQGYWRVQGSRAVVENLVRPCVGVGRDVPQWVSLLLEKVGFIVERHEERGNCQLYLDGKASYESPRALLAAVEGSDAPLVRLGLWPDGAACALCISGDVVSTGLRGVIRSLIRKR